MAAVQAVVDAGDVAAVVEANRPTSKNLIIDRAVKVARKTPTASHPNPASRGRSVDVAEAVGVVAAAVATAIVIGTKTGIETAMVAVAVVEAVVIVVAIGIKFPSPLSLLFYSCLAY